MWIYVFQYVYVSVCVCLFRCICAGACVGVLLLCDVEGGGVCGGQLGRPHRRRITFPCVPGFTHTHPLHTHTYTHAYTHTNNSHTHVISLQICQVLQPPRAHHCRQCGKCVRKMDHHCPWINNCVGHENEVCVCVWCGGRCEGCPWIDNCVCAWLSLSLSLSARLPILRDVSIHHLLYHVPLVPRQGHHRPIHW